ncbi:MAG: DMT family transporter [Halothiobacillus sp.]
MSHPLTRWAPPPVLVLMFGSTMWGTTWIWLKAIDGLGVGPLLISVLAYGAQFLMVLPWVLPNLLKRLRRPGHTPLAWCWLLALAALSGVSGVGFTMAMVYGDVVRSMLLFFLIPAWGVLFGRIFLGEPFTAYRLIAVVFALMGAALILGPDLRFDDNLGFSLADGSALIAGLALAGANVVFRYLQAEPMLLKLSVMQIGGVAFGLGALVFFPEPIGLITLNGLIQSVAYGATLLLGAMLATQYAVERLPSGRSAVLMTLELVIASLTAIGIGHEQPGLWVWLGGGLILSAALLEATSQTPDKPTEQTP